MRLLVLSIQPISESSFAVKFQVDDHVLLGHITEQNDGDSVYYNLDEEFFNGLLHYEGIGRRFNIDYFAYRDGTSVPFPWDYGEYSDDLIDRIERISREKLSQYKVN